MGAKNIKARRITFAGYHPLINFLFYIFVIVFTIILMHPFYLAVSLFCAFLYAVITDGARALKFFLFFVFPMLLLIAILNPLLNHRGVTMLFYIGDNPVTLEAIVFGVVSGAMLAGVLLWFVSYNHIISSDKFIYLFGRIIPKIALILSMSLRLIPKMKRQIKIIANAQNMIGKGMRGGSLFKKIKNGLRIISILITWSLENGIETSDSMKARGYGIKGRTSFSMYTLERRDKVVLPLLSALIIFCIAGVITGVAYCQYYPFFLVEKRSIFGIFVFAAFTAICMLPIILETGERIKWRYLISKI